ncbi:hypothetical protein N7D90_24450 (plasmid) [Pseudomonas fragi]|uniref:hypothetical protein n=1 Tax=Pseudomonas fragi TaxID=296 RepID=UPI0021BE8F97|nr:hypothetical protein [Pseudomonas fragi]UXL41084.1 hypothetical protein N7D90_24450 [Pseudomonas fragi]
MFNFWKKRREAEQQRKADQVLWAHDAEQQRKIEQLLRTQKEFLVLYELPARPATLQDELATVKASIERGLRDDRG